MDKPWQISLLLMAIVGSVGWYHYGQTHMLGPWFDGPTLQLLVGCGERCHGVRTKAGTLRHGATSTGPEVISNSLTGIVMGFGVWTFASYSIYFKVWTISSMLLTLSYSIYSIYLDESKVRCDYYLHSGLGFVAVICLTRSLHTVCESHVYVWLEEYTSQVKHILISGKINWVANHKRSINI